MDWDKVIVSRDQREETPAHKPNCRWANNIALQNRREITVSQAKREGYEPCEECKPW